LAVDQLAQFPGFHPAAMGDALDVLKSEFVQAHAARRVTEVAEAGEVEERA